MTADPTVDEVVRLETIIETCGEVLECLRGDDPPHDRTLIADIERLQAHSEQLLAALKRTESEPS